MNDNQRTKIFHFTVAQLIEILKTLPQDAPVLTSGYKNGFENFYYPEVVTLKHEPENMYYDGAFQKADEDELNSFQAVVLIREMRDD